MAIKTITVDGTTYDIGVTVTNIEGTLPVSKGGTGVTSTPSLLTNLESTSASNPFASAPRPGVTGTLPISRGGTGATTAAAAKTALGISDTDTKVTQTASTTSGGYPLLASAMTQSNFTSGSAEAIVDTDIAINPAVGKLTIRNSTYSSSLGQASGFCLYDNSASKYYGSLQVHAQGTASTTGIVALWLGNNVASGTAGNSSGAIYLYGSSAYYAGIYSAAQSANRSYTIPNAGANADFVMTAGAQTIGGNKTFSGIAYFANGTTYYINASGNAKFNTLTAAGAATFSSTSTHTGAATFNNKIIGKSGTASTGNYTTTIPSNSTGTTGQIMFVLQE